MSEPRKIGPLQACAIFDAYGAGFEFATTPYIKKHNRMEGYIPHPKFQRLLGTYTDDTQMAIGLTEHLLATPVPDSWTPVDLAERWVQNFHRDERTGYSQHFYDLLRTVTTGAELLAKITPHSIKNGGAMRAFPVGYLPAPAVVRDKAMFQASLTHTTWDGMSAAAAAALMFHHRYYNLGPKTSLVPFLEKWVPGVPWGIGVRPSGAPTGGIPTVQKAIGVLLRCHSLTDALQMAVALGGDTDTVAAIVAPAAAVCAETRNALPDVLVDGLEDGMYGRHYIRGLDEQMQVKFPTPPPLEIAKPATKRHGKISRPAKVASPADEGPCDFLFRDP